MHNGVRAGLLRVKRSMLNINKFIIALLLLSASLWAQTSLPPIAQKGPPNVAVMPFSGDQNVTSEQLNFITSMFMGELNGTNAFTVLDRGKMEFILKEQGFQQSGSCNSSECHVQMGQLLGVDDLIVGNLVRFGKTYALHLDYVNVGTGQIVKSVNAEQKGDLESVYKDLCRSGAESLVSALSTKPLEMDQSVNPAELSDSKKVPADAMPKLPSKPMSVKRKVALALWGTAALGAGGGYYFDSKASSYLSDYNTAATQWQTPANRSTTLAATLTDNYNNATNAKTYRNISYGISLTALVAGAVLWFLP